MSSSSDDNPNLTAVILPPDPDDAADATALVPLRYRFDGWVAHKQRTFLRVLGETGCIRDACRAVGMSKTSAYRLRARSAEFAAAWDVALQMAATVLEQVAYQRAVIGIEEPVWHYGKFMGMRRRYSDSILRMMVLRGDLRAGVGKSPAELVRAAEEAAKLAGGVFAREVGRASREETDNALREKLDGLARRMKREESIRAIALADRLRLAGKAP